MSNKIELNTIQAPALTSTEYGANINEKFQNINDNFSKLANTEIYRGPAGKSIRIENVPVCNDKNTNDIGYQLYDALKSAINQNIGNNTAALGPVLKNSVSWDGIISNNQFKVPITITDDNTYIGSSIPVLFMDARFDSNTIASVEDLDEYEGKIDCTCIVMFKYENKKWECEINKSFPTLKYERENFYWVLGEETSIIKATGIKGERGDTATIWVCKQESVNNENEIIVNEYLNDNGQFVSFGENDGVPGDTVIVYEKTNGSYDGFFVSTLYSREEDSNNTYKWKVKIQPDIQNINYISNIKELFKSINKKDATGVTGADDVLNNSPRGMFLLFNPDEQVSEAQNLAHVLYVTGNTGTPVTIDNKKYTIGTQLNLTPVENYEPDEKTGFKQTPNNVFNIQYDVITKSINAKADTTHSNILYGVNNPGNDGIDDFGTDVEKNGYPLVICSNNKAGDFENKYMVHGPGDIYCIGKTGNSITGYTYVPQLLCLQDRTRHFGDVLIGNNLTVGDADNKNGTKKLHVLGNAEIGGSLGVADSAIVGSLGVTGNATIHGSLTVDQNVTLKSETVTIGRTGPTDPKAHMSLYGRLYVSGDANIGRNLGVTGNANIYGNLGVTGNATVGGSLRVAGSAIVGSLGVTGNATVHGNATVGGSLRVAGSAIVGNLGVTGAATVHGNATVGGSLRVAGSAIVGSLGVTGNATIHGSLRVAGSAIVGSLGVTGNATVGGSLRVAGTAIVGSLGVTGAATVHGNATVGGSLGVAGTAIVGSLGVTGAATVHGNATVGGSLRVAGSAIVGSLGVTGNATVGSLGVTGNAKVGGTLNVANSVVIGGNLKLTQNIHSGVDGTYIKRTAVEGDNYIIYTFNCSYLASEYIVGATSEDFGKRNCKINITNYTEGSIKPVLIEMKGIHNSVASQGNRTVEVYLNNAKVYTLNNAFDSSKITTDLGSVRLGIQILNSNFVVIVWKNNQSNDHVACYKSNGVWYSD